MNIRIFINGAEATDSCRLSATRIAYDTSKRVTTAQITVLGRTPGVGSRYDYAHYDQDRYGLDLRELYTVTIRSGVDNSKLFEGQIFTMDLEQTDAPNAEVWYQCGLNDWSAWLDRDVCTGIGFTLPMPSSDKNIITALVTQYGHQITLGTIAEIVPVIMDYDWRGKTLRQVLDDLVTLSMGEWRVNFDGVLSYGPAGAAPHAPFALSTSPDFAASYPVRVENYKRDFSNPVNRCYVRGAWDPANGLLIEANYQDPVSIATYGEYQSSIVDDSIITGWDASLRAKSTVLRYAYPIESGGFTFFERDGLACGQLVHITEDALAIDDDYLIRALSMEWLDQDRVKYVAQFGALKPDLETYLRLIDQRSRWKTSKPSASVPLPGSVTDASIAAGGLHAGSIANVNANTIIGTISASQIGSVNAGAIVGTVSADQIATVNAGSIQGVITSGQIGSVNAAVIQGVILSSQLGDKIVDDLAKYADALRPIPMVTSFLTLPSDNFPPNTFFYNETDGHFYKISTNGLSWAVNDSPENVQMKFYHIGAITAKNITGLILAAQIQSITAGQITGLIQAAQIGSVNASSISGTISAGQIATVNASAIQGSISAGQIGSINAATITIGLIGDSQIGTISGGKLIVGTVNSDKLNSYSIDVGGGINKPGRINVYDGGSTLVAQIGTVDSGGVYGGWFKVLGVGGTGYGDAKMKTDTPGNLYIYQANFTITSGSFTINMTPTTFDASYGSLTVDVTGPGSDKASHVSRGFLVYNSRFLGGLVRDPANALNCQLVLYNSANALAILLDGYSGVIRATQFSQGGNPGKTQTYNGIDGQTIVFNGGICTDMTPATRTGFWTTKTVLLNGGGSVTFTFNNGLLVNAV